MDSKTYWPFDPVPPALRTELQHLQVQLMEESFRRGFRAWIDGSTETGVTYAGRTGMIYRRGARHCFEMILTGGGVSAVSAMVDEFECAGFAVLAWMRTGRVDEAMKYVAGHEARSRSVSPKVGKAG